MTVEHRPQCWCADCAAERVRPWHQREPARLLALVVALLVALVATRACAAVPHDESTKEKTS